MRRCKENGCRELIPYESSYCKQHELLNEAKVNAKQLEQKRLESVSEGYRASERHTRYSNSERSHELGHAFYQSNSWRILSNRVRVRDLYVCKSCGRVQQPDESYVVDHITPRRTAPELAMTENNLWLLCRTCHNKKSAYEKRMAPEELKRMSKNDWVKLLK